MVALKYGLVLESNGRINHISFDILSLFFSPVYSVTSFASPPLSSPPSFLLNGGLVKVQHSTVFSSFFGVFIRADGKFAYKQSR